MVSGPLAVQFAQVAVGKNWAIDTFYVGPIEDGSQHVCASCKDRICRAVDAALRQAVRSCCTEAQARLTAVKA
jgi:hypothetical protein